jgi:hypothetical protein
MIALDDRYGLGRHVEIAEDVGGPASLREGELPTIMSPG